MKPHRRYAPHEMSDLEDGVCRTSHAAALALLVVESVTTGGKQVTAIPLSKDERELLNFAVAEVYDCAGKAKSEFYKLGKDIANAKS